MYIQNATYKAVPTAGLTFPLAEGTVLTVGDVTGIVPENISLAAPTGLIYLAVGGTIDLTSEANAGVSFTDAEMNALGGDFNFIPVTEAGGSSLPSYTSADKGKVLTIGDASPVETEVVVIPEQSVTYEGDAVLLSNAEGAASLNDGTSVVLFVNGQRYETTFSKSDIRVEFETNKFYHVYNGKGASVYFEAYNTAVPGHEGDVTPIIGTYTVSLSAVQSVTPSVQTFIVPEQSVTIGEGASAAFLANSEGVSSLANGDAVVLNVNGTAYNTIVFDDWRGKGVSVSINATDRYSVTYNSSNARTSFRALRNVDDGDGMSHNEGIAGTYVVSLTAPRPAVEPKWENVFQPLPTENGNYILTISNGAASWTRQNT